MEASVIVVVDVVVEDDDDAVVIVVVVVVSYQNSNHFIDIFITITSATRATITITTKTIIKQ